MTVATPSTQTKEDQRKTAVVLEYVQYAVMGIAAIVLIVGIVLTAIGFELTLMMTVGVLTISVVMGWVSRRSIATDSLNRLDYAIMVGIATILSLVTAVIEPASMAFPAKIVGIEITSPTLAVGPWLGFTMGAFGLLGGWFGAKHFDAPTTQAADNAPVAPKVSQT